MKQLEFKYWLALLLLLTVTESVIHDSLRLEILGTGIVPILVLAAVNWKVSALHQIALKCVLIMYGLGVVSYTIWKGYSHVSEGEWWQRVELFATNPNLLGGSIAVSGVILLLILRPSWPWALLLICSFLTALLFTGSRMGLISYFVALCLLSGSARTRFGRIVTVVVSALAAFMFAPLLLSPATPNIESKHNLLNHTNRLDHSSWRHDKALDLQVTRRIETRLVPTFDTEPPYTIHGVAGVSTTSENLKGMLFYQSTGPSEPSKFYVASAYLRSDRPIAVIISSNLHSDVCTLNVTWQRCHTKATEGDGHTHAQFQIRTVQPGTHANFEIYGAQLEVGMQPTAVQETGVAGISALVEDTIFKRIVRRPQEDANVLARIEAFKMAWQIFLQSPLVGNGSRVFLDGERGFENQYSARHAHNLFLQLLATRGLLGLLITLAPYVFLWFTHRKTFGELIPLFIAAILVNLADYTYFYAGVFFPIWMSIGYLLLRQFSSIKVIWTD